MHHRANGVDGDEKRMRGCDLISGIWDRSDRIGLSSIRGRLCVVGWKRKNAGRKKRGCIGRRTLKEVRVSVHV